MRRGLQTASVAVLAGLLVAGGAFLQHVRETRYPVNEEADETLYVTSGRDLSRLTKGYHAIAADLYWIRTIQYYGGTKRAKSTGASSDYRLLYPLLDPRVRTA